MTLTIDTPLGFSDAFIQLITQSEAAASIDASNTNPYLLLRTGHYLSGKGLSLLSVMKDMGSQAAKWIHGKVLMNVGGYSMANAGGRLAGTVLSGRACQPQGFEGSPWWSAAFLSFRLPETGQDQ